jgi:DNA helicase-2/ATP-dependent DNA helicase PcrA
MVQTFATWATRELGRAIPWLRFDLVDDAPPVVTRAKTDPALLHELERRAGAKGVRRTTRAVVQLWAELLSDRGCLEALLGGAGDFTGAQIAEVHRFVSDRATAVLDVEPGERDDDAHEHAAPDDEEERGAVGVDGLATERERPQLDLDDVALLLRAHQLVRGVPDKRRLAHLFVDEAQDLSPTALATLLAQTTSGRSVTLAGDTAQRLFLYNGFEGWRAVLGHLGLAAVAIEPLKIAYRSTREILDVARHAMGPLADPDPPTAPRTGAPVEAHRFPGTGAAVAFVAEALRSLFAREPRASVAVLARHPAQADRWADGLARAEVPSLRRIRAQEFAFRPGVEVTDVRQVKGLEFDYVIMVDVNANVFGADDEARHLFHIAATRAAHGLWLIVTGPTSPLVPPALLSDDRPAVAPATPSPRP